MQKYLRNGLLTLKPQRNDENVKFDISVKSILPSDNMECEETAKEYDNCVMNEIQDMLKNCTLPFLNNNDRNLLTCKSFEYGLEALKIFNKEETSCNVPCYQINQNVQLNPSRPVISMKNPSLNITKNPGYYFNFPSKVLRLEMSKEYGIITFIAEFGGWSGLFVGVSLLTIISKIIHKMSSDRTKTKKFTKRTAIFCLVFVLGLVSYFSIRKLLDHETGQDIQINAKYSDISLSICNEEPIFSHSSNYLGENIEFWKTGSNISTIFNRIVLTYKDGTVKTLKTNNKTITGDRMPESQAIIQNMIDTNNEVQFCQTIEIDNVRQIKIKALKDIFLYIHLNKHFRSNIGKTRLSVLPSNSIKADMYVSKKERKYYLHDTTTKIQLVYNEKVEKHTQSYDDCFSKYFKITHNENVWNLLQPMNISSLRTGINANELKEYMRSIEQIRRMCPNSHDYVKATYETKPEVVRHPIDMNSTEIYQDCRQPITFIEKNAT